VKVSTRNDSLETTFGVDSMSAGDLLRAHEYEMANANATIGLLRSENKRLEEQYGTLLTLAEHLFQMIPRETWRDFGGDDGQGHYEGEYRAEQIEQELHALRDSFPATEPDA
jgi:hypothetical protein